MALFARFALVCALACAPAPSPPRVAAKERPVPRILLVWVDPAARIPEKPIMDGCRAWEAAAVRCQRTSSSDYADLYVMAHDAPCSISPRGRSRLADYWPRTRQLTIRMGCLDGDFDEDALAELRAAAVYGFGRAFGIRRQ